MGSVKISGIIVPRGETVAISSTPNRDTASNGRMKERKYGQRLRGLDF
jgi:hypothetical protein